VNIPLQLLLGVLREPARLSALPLAEWDRLLIAARATGLLGRLGAFARELGVLDDIDERPVHHLRDADLQARQQHAMLRWEATRIEQALRDTDTPIVLLKGAAYVLAETPALAGRECSDIDILVSGEQLDDVEAALIANDWVFDDLPPKDQVYFRRWLHELPPMRHARRGTSIDVHHSLLPRTDRLFIDSSAFFARAVPVAGSISVLAPADMVLHSAVHMFRNGDWSHALRDLSDQDLLLREFSLQEDFWDNIVATARSLNLTATCFYCLRYAHLYFGTPVPERVWSLVADWKPRTSVLRLIDALVLRAVCPRHDDRIDRLRSLSLALLSSFPAPRLGAWLTPLFWTKRLRSGLV